MAAKPTSSLLPAGSCDGYINITESWRNINFTSTSFTGHPKNDRHLYNQWFRFKGIGGDRVIQTCINEYNAGGTTYIINVPFTLPTNESTASTGTAYYFYSGSCTTYGFSMSVVLCPGGFYMYNLQSEISDASGFVTCELNCFN